MEWCNIQSSVLRDYRRWKGWLECDTRACWFGIQSSISAKSAKLWFNGSRKLGDGSELDVRDCFDQLSKNLITAKVTL